MIKKYKKKPVIIEAVQWTGENHKEIDEFITMANRTKIGSTKISINTLEGIMTADIGDYIIKGVQGEFYPCKPDIFEQTYEEVNDESKFSV